MGVYIKGMKMPQNCRACRLKMNCDDCEGFECVCLPLHTQIGHLNDLLTDKRRDDCPLVLVPPHGRLIDASEEITVQMYDEQYEDFSQVKMTIDDLLSQSWIDAKAPTVIPAEEGET